ncbi:MULTISPECIES: DUF883 family protein [Rahnella]|jgi:uncharacterized protein YjbJ (UPF0337 family)|uniref:CsbD family protein n=1 Tax=Rahnella victoriana TaxID=1510570 RepID=A0ABS0DUZ8_9GAMM|nr:MULTISPECIES: CsbD family protein [Rahnella]VTQ52433.1 Bacterial protein of uncharacterised function (DUF883) [Campylobacter jejuni]MBF7957689.1 CsbD family protein [Rahnella victoriana]PBI77683.1 hypothetical protein A9993_22695 [Rahnella victoriana]TBX31578.1 CsbD family protein [Rahnella victoriana]TDS97987.1 hypothetical protein EDF78_101362 [Rahnella sp. BIGb0236]
MSSQDFDKDPNRVEDKVENTVNQFAGEAQKQFGDFVDSPKHQLKGAARKYSAQAGEVVSDVADKIKENPLSGLIAAGAIGVVLGLLLGRK